MNAVEAPKRAALSRQSDCAVAPRRVLRSRIGACLRCLTAHEGRRVSGTGRIQGPGARPSGLKSMSRAVCLVYASLVSSAFAVILCSLCIERLCESKAGLGPEAMAGGPVTSCFSAQLLRAWMAEFLAFRSSSHSSSSSSNFACCYDGCCNCCVSSCPLVKVFRLTTGKGDPSHSSKETVRHTN